MGTFGCSALGQFLLVADRMVIGVLVLRIMELSSSCSLLILTLRACSILPSATNTSSERQSEALKTGSNVGIVLVVHGCGWPLV